MLSWARQTEITSVRGRGAYSFLIRLERLKVESSFSRTLNAVSLLTALPKIL